MLPVSPIKMRVLCSSSKAKIKTFASALGEAFYTQAQNVPPAYPCEKERLVLLVISLNGAPNDQLRRFCSELTPARAYNVALVVDNKEQQQGIQAVKDILTQAGTNVLDDPLLQSLSVSSTLLHGMCSLCSTQSKFCLIA